MAYGWSSRQSPRPRPPPTRSSSSRIFRRLPTARCSRCFSSNSRASRRSAWSMAGPALPLWSLRTTRRAALPCLGSRVSRSLQHMPCPSALPTRAEGFLGMSLAGEGEGSRSRAYNLSPQLPPLVYNVTHGSEWSVAPGVCVPETDLGWQLIPAADEAWVGEEACGPGGIDPRAESCGLRGVPGDKRGRLRERRMPKFPRAAKSRAPKSGRRAGPLVRACE